MRSLFLITVVLFMFPAIAAAQVAWLYAGYGNAFQGFPGAVYAHSGIVGFEYAPKMLGAGFELEARRTATLSLNGYFHFPLGKKRQIAGEYNKPVVPFVTAGYSHAYLQYRTGLNLFNFGGGIDFFGFVRPEIRDSVSFENGVVHHYPEFRTTLNFLPFLAAF
jgi:hypothetical protein